MSGNAHYDVIITSSKVWKNFYVIFKTLGVLTRFYTNKLWDTVKKVAFTMKKKIVWAFRKSTGKVEYLIPSLRKSHLKYRIFRKILQKMTKFLLKQTDIFKPSVAFRSSDMHPNSVYCAIG